MFIYHVVNKVTGELVVACEKTSWAVADWVMSTFSWTMFDVYKMRKVGREEKAVLMARYGY